MKRIDRCNLCDKKTEKTCKRLFRTHDRMHDIPGEYTYTECRNCGLVFINPQPSPKEISRHYPKGYYSFGISDMKFKRFQIFLYKTYFSDEDNRNIFLRAVFMPFRRILRTIKIVEDGKFLDVGCGSGDFLQIPKELGFECYGVEPGNFDAKSAKKRGFRIFHGTLREAGYKEDFFDVITLNHVFEHMDDPSGTLKELKRILKKDGMIRIAVPQKRSLAYWIFGRYWVQLDAPRHFFIYSESTLRTYAKKSGLKVSSVRYVSSPFQFTQSVIYWAKDKDLRWLGRIFETKIAFLILFPLSFACNRLHIGDSIEIILSKEMDK